MHFYVLKKCENSLQNIPNFTNTINTVTKSHATSIQTNFCHSAHTLVLALSLSISIVYYSCVPACLKRSREN